MKKLVFTMVALIAAIFTFNIGTGYAVEGIRGADRYETAVKISQETWETADTVVLAKGTDFPDALAGGPLAYKENAPILLTKTENLTAVTKGEIIRLNAKKVIILGGNASISQAVETELKGMELEIERIGGKTRYETAVNIAKKLPSDQAILANGKNFPDALAVSPYAAKNGIPILLTATESLNSSTKAALADKESTIIVGGVGAVSEKAANDAPNPTRYSGPTRYETAKAIALNLPLGNQKAMIVSGQKFPDALAGSVLAARENAPLLLVKQIEIPEPTAFLMNQYREFMIVGGTAVIAPLIHKKAEAVEQSADGWKHIYYFNNDHGGISMYNLITKEETVVYEGQYTYTYNVLAEGEYVYFINSVEGTIERMNKNGTGVTTIFADEEGRQVSQFKIVDGSIYFHFSEEEADQSIFKLSLDGSEVSTYLDLSALSSLIDFAIDGPIVYTYHMNSGIYAYNMDTGEVRGIYTEMDTENPSAFYCDCSMQVLDDKIYFTMDQFNLENQEYYTVSATINKDATDLSILSEYGDTYHTLIGDKVYFFVETITDDAITVQVSKSSLTDLSVRAKVTEFTVGENQFYNILYQDESTILVDIFDMDYYFIKRNSIVQIDL
ncbi:cell wall-binding repeat-containing protein [Bacillus haimaensis]|uniref:cell wall-binding repeat-containing protein n=1 Tax=Bacillus haimaensis TaxID=3160967 RepID=UPI003AA8B34B